MKKEIIVIILSLLLAIASTIICDYEYKSRQKLLLNKSESLLAINQKNESDSLIADETYICTDTIGLGYTLNSNIGLELLEKGYTITKDGDYYWFQYQNEILHICTDNTHLTCDSKCECDGMRCN